jgi:hypothetical protein
MKIICRIVPRNPIAIEKFDVIPQMGRFTLRDEGKTIAVGKVLKYKPYTKGIVGAEKNRDDTKTALTKQMGDVVITNSAPEMVFDMETGELKPKKPEMVSIAEGDENDE